MGPVFEIRKIAVLIALFCSALASQAQSNVSGNGETVNALKGEATQTEQDLKEVTVSSTRSMRRVDNAPNVVTVTTAEDIQELGARNVSDVFKNSVDVTVPQQTARFSLAVGSQGRAAEESINIRGLQGNNVLLLVDGIRIPNAFSFGALSTGRGNFLDVDGYRKIEVVRGPSSTQYGSDGLAGIVNFQTFNPTDFIKTGEDKGGFAKTAYSSVDKSSNTTFGYAGKNDQVQGLILGNVSAGHQYQNQGSDYSTGTTRSAPNPADYGNWYVLSKGLVAINSANKLGLTYESQSVNRNVNNLSDLGSSGGAWGRLNVVSSTANDTTTKNRVSGDYNYQDRAGEYIQKANVMLYFQDASVKQQSYQMQSGTIPSPWRARNNSYSQNTYGINSTLESNTTALVNQRLTYGFDWSSANISSQITAAGNGVSITPAPQSIYELSGAFLQSEMEFGNLSLIPALRYDAYSIKPQSGASAINSGSAVSPRVGAVWNITKEFRPFANWGTAFSAPTPDQALPSYAGFAGPVPYKSIPNPDLKPQTGIGYELGMRGKVEQWRYQASVYSNNYSNFISQVSTPTNPIIFQYQNLNQVTINGWDLRTDWIFRKGWQANAAMAYSQGTQKQDGVSAPLNTIQPLRGILGLRYDSAEWGGFANWVWNQGKSASKVNFNGNTGGTPNQFLSPASSVLNLTAYWKPSKQLTFNFNVNNVFNSTYWNWSSVQKTVTTVSTPSYNANAVQQSATSAPRNAQISVRYDF
ncbi:hemoglobin/transferrin/lactoferrin receptor protein [Polynucleobacter meluiroseus]|uniref:Hemoglobin/transferrin/lactoferrin receptor protein n=2 Tax=Polynucleobacter meluiroseus TaxID=1938814 RepID=A0A240DY64_9BURK|nr:hemoglobin/transferrin/lactoferrin receptor protein [Polynucleobacter meluiroseus]